MLLLYLLLIQFAVSNGNFMCMYSQYPKCFQSFVASSGGQYCPGAEQTIECMKEKAIQCDVENSGLVLDLELGLKEMCQKGTQLNEAYLKHKKCIFDIPAKVLEPCYWDVMRAFRNYPLTGNADADELGMFKLTCKYDDKVTLCLSGKVFEVCGEEADRFYEKFKGPSKKLITTACMESSAATFGLVYTLLLQVSIVQFAMSNGDLVCFYDKSPECYAAFVGRRDHEYCFGVNQTIECFKEKTIECNAEHSRVVIDIQQRFNEACQDGTELNKAYLKHKACVFEQAVKSAAPCYEDSLKAIHNYNWTCKFDSQAYLCLSEKVAEICEEAEGFFHEFFGPTMDLVKRVCMENGATSFEFVWTLMLQASTILFAQKLSNLTI